MWVCMFWNFKFIDAVYQAPKKYLGKTFKLKNFVLSVSIIILFILFNFEATVLASGCELLLLPSLYSLSYHNYDTSVISFRSHWMKKKVVNPDMDKER